MVTNEFSSKIVQWQIQLIKPLEFFLQAACLPAFPQKSYEPACIMSDDYFEIYICLFEVYTGGLLFPALRPKLKIRIFEEESQSMAFKNKNLELFS